jgi:hypothetical protein
MGNYRTGRGRASTQGGAKEILSVVRDGGSDRKTAEAYRVK